jgi:hypothetical protein
MSTINMPEELDAATITALLSNTRTRGGHLAFVQKFVASGDMAWIVNHDPSYKGKTPAQLDTSVKQGILAAATKAQLTIKCVWNGDKDNGGDLLIVNPEVVAAQLSA